MVDLHELFFLITKYPQGLDHNTPQHDRTSHEPQQHQQNSPPERHQPDQHQTQTDKMCIISEFTSTACGHVFGLRDTCSSYRYGDCTGTVYETIPSEGYCSECKTAQQWANDRRDNERQRQTHEHRSRRERSPTDRRFSYADRRDRELREDHFRPSLTREDRNRLDTDRVARERERERRYPFDLEESRYWTQTELERQRQLIEARTREIDEDLGGFRNVETLARSRRRTNTGTLRSPFRYF